MLPSPEWKQKRFSRPEQQKWYAGETISIGIGQGYNAYTPLQLAQSRWRRWRPTATCTGRTWSSTIDNPRTGERRHIEPVAGKARFR